MKLLINWKDFNKFDRKHYRDNINKLFADVNLCSRYKCNLDHRALLDRTYKYLINCFKDCTNELTFHKQRKFTPIADWSSFCKEKYECGRQAFLLWVANDGISQGNLFDTMICTRKAFVNALSFCKKNKQIIRNNILAIKTCISFGKKLERGKLVLGKLRRK